jgi:predicted phage baseplate assembly protein
VAEIDNDGRAHLRYGDGDLGMQPAALLRFLASYRTGYGPAGNVGAETITHLVYYHHRPDGIRSVRNPLPASGGTAPEQISEVKLFAPHAFRRRLERAVIASDYAEIVMRDFSAVVQRANAELHWTGSGYEALVAVDALGGAEATPQLLAEIEAHLSLYRRIGHTLAVRPAYHAGLVVEMEVCAAPDYFPEQVKEALFSAFSTRRLPGGALGFFHPDQLSFGKGIRRSDIVAEAMKIPGVLSADVTGLRRISDPHDPTGEKPDDAVVSGLLPLGALEIARLDNDPSRPEHGKMVIKMRGGR